MRPWPRAMHRRPQWAVPRVSLFEASVLASRFAAWPSVKRFARSTRETTPTAPVGDSCVTPIANWQVRPLTTATTVVVGWKHHRRPRGARTRKRVAVALSVTLMGVRNCLGNIPLRAPVRVRRVAPRFPKAGKFDTLWQSTEYVQAMGPLRRKPVSLPGLPERDRPRRGSVRRGKCTSPSRPV